MFPCEHDAEASDSHRDPAGVSAGVSRLPSSYGIDGDEDLRWADETNALKTRRQDRICICVIIVLERLILVDIVVDECGSRPLTVILLETVANDDVGE